MRSTKPLQATYRFADREFNFNITPEDLCNFQVVDGISQSIEAESQRPVETNLIEAEGWVFDQFSKVILKEDQSAFWIEYPHGYLFCVSRDGTYIDQVKPDPLKSSDYRMELLLGPPLILALALRDAWCLHASAVEKDGKVIVFLGDSGAGKSTLAEFLTEQEGFNRICDDILPVEVHDGIPFALPQFPQLKFPLSRQPWTGRAPSLPISHFFTLEIGEVIGTQLQSQAEAALVLSGNIVAARLFNPDLLAKSFNFSVEVAQETPLSSIYYPHNYSLLPDVQNKIEDILTEWPDSTCHHQP